MQRKWSGKSKGCNRQPTHQIRHKERVSTAKKQNWRDPNNVKGFWLLEWLKTVWVVYGSYTRLLANPKRPTQCEGSQNYVLIAFKAGLECASAGDETFSSGNERKPNSHKNGWCWFPLQYTQAFLKHYMKKARVDDLGEDIFGEPPAD